VNFSEDGARVTNQESDRRKDQTAGDQFNERVEMRIFISDLPYLLVMKIRHWRPPAYYPICYSRCTALSIPNLNPARPVTRFIRIFNEPVFPPNSVKTIIPPRRLFPLKPFIQRGGIPTKYTKEVFPTRAIPPAGIPPKPNPISGLTDQFVFTYKP
jgi:hypothetical protein